MSFSQSSRVWWDSNAPGAGTASLNDADVAGTPAAAEDSGTVGVHKGQLTTCERSGFTVPLSETVIDPNTGRRVFWRFKDPPAPDTNNLPTRPPSRSTLVS
jgi:hypothetical protein